MGKRIFQLIVWDNEDNSSKDVIYALGELDQFSEQEKERWIVVVIWAHDVVWKQTAHLIAQNLACEHLVFAQKNTQGEVVVVEDIPTQKPRPTMKTLIQVLWDDIEKEMIVVKNNIDAYEILQKSDIANKKTQEKWRRKYMNKRKVSTRKKG